MAGALADGPRPVSVIAVEGTEVQQQQQEQQQQQHQHQQTGVGHGGQNAVSRSFILTEVQTESSQAPGGSGPGEIGRGDNEETRDARRRERRMRRQHRRAMRSCSMPPTYAGGPCVGQTGAPGVPLVPSAVGGFLHPPPPHLGLRGLSLGLPFPVPTSVSAFGR